MKKIMALLLALVMVIGLVACGDANKPTEPSTDPVVTDPATDPATEPSTDPVTEPDVTEPDATEPEVTEPVGGEETPVLSNVETKLLALFEICPTEFPVMTWKLDLTDAESVKAFTGLDSIDGIIDIAVTEPAMSSQAYSVVLIELAEGADAEAIAAAVKEGVNPRKWVCVEADAMDTAIVDNYVLFVMMSTDFAETITVEDVTAAFVTMMEAPAEGDVEAPADGAADEEAPVDDATEATTEATAETTAEG